MTAPAFRLVPTASRAVIRNPKLLTRRDLDDAEAELRSNLSGPSGVLMHEPDSPLIQAIINSGRSRAGEQVTANKALSVTVVFSCVRLISDTLAAMPLKLYRKVPGKIAEEVRDDPRAQLLRGMPNEWQTSYDWRQNMCSHVELRGNAYSRLVRDGAGRVLEILPLHPDFMQVFRSGDDGPPLYVYRNKPLNRLDVLHIPGPSVDGVKGLDMVSVLRESVGLARAAENYAAQFFNNDSSPSGVIQLPLGKKLSSEGIDRLRATWEAAHGAHADGRQKTAILEDGSEWKPVSLSHEQAQFLQSRKFQIEEITRVFGVPRHMVGDLDRATYSNIEHQFIEFLTLCMTPRLRRWEQRLTVSLLTEAERAAGYYFEFVADSILRGDAKSRAEAQKHQIEVGTMTRNEARAMENRAPLEGLDEPLTPRQMFAGDPTKMTNSDQQTPARANQ